MYSFVLLSLVSITFAGLSSAAPTNPELPQVTRNFSAVGGAIAPVRPAMNVKSPNDAFAVAPADIPAADTVAVMSREKPIARPNAEKIRDILDGPSDESDGNPLSPLLVLTTPLLGGVLGTGSQAFRVDSISSNFMDPRRLPVGLPLMKGLF